MSELGKEPVLRGHTTLPQKKENTEVRRSFTLPRSLLPSREPKGKRALSNFFLSLTRTRRKVDESRYGILHPAAIGLRNQGNTCFMNAVIQCLSHTDALARYLVTDAYKTDIRKRLWSKNGKGEVTEELAKVVKSAWLGKAVSLVEEASISFKSAVEKASPVWRGNEQQDAQEFLIWLLNRLHEDLNHPRKQKSFKKVGHLEEEVGVVSTYVRTNNSRIQEIFGHFGRSSLTCPGCRRQSATFEPFVTLSLPIPLSDGLPLYASVLFLSQQPRLVKVGLMVGDGGVREGKEALALHTGLAPERLLLLEIDGEGFHRTFTETQEVDVLSTNECLYCLETPEKTDGDYVLITWLNVLSGCSGAGVRFGSPYICKFSRETSYEDFQKLLLKEMATILRPGVLIQEQQAGVFGIRLLDGSSEGVLLEPGVPHPLYTEAVDDALALCDHETPSHVKIHLLWSPQIKEELVWDESENVEELGSVRETREHASKGETVSLGACLEAYTGSEELSPEDTWLCPHCNQKEEGTLKMIRLCSAPEILLVHLNRFRQATKGRSSVRKISCLVDFPLEGLDLGPHLSAHSMRDKSFPKTPNKTFGWRASFRKKRREGKVEEDCPVYDLFAVINHHGKEIQGGHYTAYCKNPVEGDWWSFDDTRVSRIPTPKDVRSPDAYMLFYERRRVPMQIHWILALREKSPNRATDEKQVSL